MWTSFTSSTSCCLPFQGSRFETNTDEFTLIRPHVVGSPNAALTFTATVHHAMTRAKHRKPREDYTRTWDDGWPEHYYHVFAHRNGLPFGFSLLVDVESSSTRMEPTSRAGQRTTMICAHGQESLDSSFSLSSGKSRSTIIIVGLRSSIRAAL